MPDGSRAVKDSWARSIKLKELQEALDKLRTESWAALQAERFEEALVLRNRLEDLEIEIAEVKAVEARATQDARRAKAAAAAAAGVLALPSLDDQLRELQQELEQARAADDLGRAVEARRRILELQDDPERSTSGAASSRARLALPSDPAKLAIADFDPREVPNVEIEVPMPKRRTGASASSGRAAERYLAMQAELKQAVDSGDQEQAVELRRRLEAFRLQFQDGTPGELNAARPEAEARPRAPGRKGRGKGRGAAAHRAAPHRGASEAGCAGCGPGAPTAKAVPKARPPKPEGQDTALTADQVRAQKQVESWRQEVELLELGMVDYQGDEECREALDLRRRLGELRAKSEELARAAAEDGPALEAALAALDPDSMKNRLAALARLNKAPMTR